MAPAREAGPPPGELNPVQQRVAEELLLVGVPRVPGDTDQAQRLEDELSAATAEAAGLVPEGRRLFLSKSRIDALACDGRYLDQADAPFEWSVPLVRGHLAHAAIELDLAGGQTRDAAEVVAYAWQRLATTGDAAGDFLTTLGGVEADDLRAQARRVLLDFRDQFPPLPEAWQPRAEQPLRRELHGGRVVVQGRPDLQIGRPTSDYRRLLLIDLKTGGRHPLRHRADMRLYALLATLKHRVAPFRVATYYLDEAAWDVEDVDDDTLEAARRQLSDAVVRAALLEFARPPEEEWRLVAGPQCAWCGRADTCPEKARADREADQLSPLP